jgi:hypothetical protein
MEEVNFKEEFIRGLIHNMAKDIVKCVNLTANGSFKDVFLNFFKKYEKKIEVHNHWLVLMGKWLFSEENRIHYLEECIFTDNLKTVAHMIADKFETGITKCISKSKTEALTIFLKHDRREDDIINYVIPTMKILAAFARLQCSTFYRQLSDDCKKVNDINLKLKRKINELEDDLKNKNAPKIGGQLKRFKASNGTIPIWDGIKETVSFIKTKKVECPVCKVDKAVNQICRKLCPDVEGKKSCNFRICEECYIKIVEDPTKTYLKLGFNPGVGPGRVVHAVYQCPQCRVGVAVPNSETIARIVEETAEDGSKVCNRWKYNNVTNCFDITEHITSDS